MPDANPSHLSNSSPNLSRRVSFTASSGRSGGGRSNNDSSYERSFNSTRPSFPAPNISKIARESSVVEEDEEQPLSTATAIDAEAKSKDAPVTWMSLPKKGQLAVLTIARLSEPLSERSLAAYMFFQLKWFDPSSPDSTIAAQGGLLTSAFAAAQFLTAVWWGRAADTPWIGRKKVLLVGLTGTAIASIGVGFSKSFWQAFFFRALAGALNGNIGVMRTMLSEIIQEKRYQSRAFLLLPMCFNIGVVIGPVLGGFLADPIASFPDVFGPGSSLGGKNGVGWMNAFPYALPNLFSGIFIFISALSIVLGLDETHEALRHKPDYGRKLGRYITALILRRKHDNYEYSRLHHDEEETELQLTTSRASTGSSNVFPRSTVDPGTQNQPVRSKSPAASTKSPFRQLMKKNIIFTLISHHLLALHVSSFNALVFLLLPAPHSPNTGYHFPSLFFSGGIGLSQSRVGLAMAILGIIGLPLQIILYPPMTQKLGPLRGYRMFLPFSILAYITIPFLVLLPATPGWLIWVALSFVLASQVLSRTFALTGTVILVNNASPGPHVLGSLHGVAQSASSAARMLGPTVNGYLLGLGFQHNFVGGVWWLMAIIAGINWILLFFIYEGDGRGGRA